MVYVPVPLARVLIGRALPVDIRAPDGRLLLRRGQTLQSEAHREMLAAHQACMTETDAQAWERALARQMRTMRQQGVDMARIASAPMPAQILDTDFLASYTVQGGWLDLQETLCNLLYQGPSANNPLARLEGIEQAVLDRLTKDPDEALFVLFQALPDLSLGYCATHALLSGVVAALTANKLSLPQEQQHMVLRAALVMNIGMARPQDNLARQRQPLSPAQRELITTHAPGSVEILRVFGADDPALLDIVHWHHAPDAHVGDAGQQMSVQLLHLADTLVAKVAPRTSRPAMTALGAARALVLEATEQTKAQRVAMASILGFYPPGTYVQLANGEVAVVIARGERANTPHVASLINPKGMPLGSYAYRDTRQADCAVRAPLPASQVNVRVTLEKTKRLRQQHGI
jgi:hypothetical protein